MTSITEESEILKLDVRGRVLVSKERREALLEEFEQSGLSGAGFARMVGVKYATFANWVAAKRRRMNAQGVAQGVRGRARGQGSRKGSGVAQGVGSRKGSNLNI